jgi:predicted DNA-binding transcriptional regulator AlpA
MSYDEALRTDGPLAYSSDGLAKRLSVSRRTVERWNSAGKLPRPIRLGGRLLRWIASEIRDWVLAGMPHRDEWERIKKERDDERKTA